MAATSPDVHSELALFPLSQPLFPGIRLDLQIFEQRYLRMIRICLRQNQGFGICAISSGSEVGRSSTIFDYGLSVNIFDWRQLRNGLLGVSVRGNERFHLRQTHEDVDGLLHAQVDYLDHEEDGPVPDTYSGLTKIYTELRQHPQFVHRLPDIGTVQASGLGWGLAQVLPMSMQDRIRCLSQTSALDRLEFLATHIQRLGASA